MNVNTIYEFGSFRFSPAEMLLSRRGTSTPLTPKAAELLLALLENRSHLIDRESLMNRVWPDAHVEEGNLNYTMHLLREALGDGVNGQQFIETVPKRGYRFIAAVKLVSADEELLNGRSDTGMPSAGAPQVLATESNRNPIAQSFPESGLLSATPNEAAEAAGVVPGAIRTRSEIRPWLALGFVIVLGILSAAGVIVFAMGGDPPTPRVVRTRQLTMDRLDKVNQLFVDRDRLYFQEFTRDGAPYVSVSVNGGQVQPIAGIPSGFGIGDISPIRGEFLGSLGTSQEPLADLLAIPTIGGPVRRFGNLRARSAILSPSGEQAIYTIGNSIFVAEANGTRPRKILTATEFPFQIHVSPDGRLLRFFLDTNKRDEDPEQALWECAIDGTHLRPISIRDGQVQLHPLRGIWSPDGNNYYFQTKEGSTFELWVRPEKKGFLRRSDPEAVKLSSFPMSVEAIAPSKDGKEIFVIGRMPQGELARYDVAAADFVRYLGGISGHWVLTSRDNKWIAYTSDPNLNLWRQRPDGSERLQLTFSPMKVEGLSWSSDAKQIAFRAQLPGRTWRIYVVAVSGGNLRELQTGESDAGIPAWSPDGSRIAYGDMPAIFGKPKGDEAIHIYELATDRITDLPGSKGLWTARWSANGKYLAALTIEHQQLMVYTFATRAWRHFDVGIVNELTFSHNGNDIYFDSYFPSLTIFRVRLSSGKLERVIGLGGYPVITSWFGLAPDDSVVVLRNIGTTEIYALDLEAR